MKFSGWEGGSGGEKEKERERERERERWGGGWKLELGCESARPLSSPRVVPTSYYQEYNRCANRRGAARARDANKM